MKYTTCPNHPGRIVENHSCDRCGHPQAEVKGRPPYRSIWKANPALGQHLDFTSEDQPEIEGVQCLTP